MDATEEIHFLSNDVPAAVKIKTGTGMEVVLAGRKKDADQSDLKVNGLITPSGEVIKLKEPIVIEFDKKTDSAKKQVLGAANNESVIKSLKQLKESLSQKEYLELFKNDDDRIALAQATVNKAAEKGYKITFTIDEVGGTVPYRAKEAQPKTALSPNH